jgi:predicted Ser/Thr protein kinase
METDVTENIKHALLNLDRNLCEADRQEAISFQAFLDLLLDSPGAVIRNVFQVFYDMVKTYVGHGIDEYPEDPESIGFVYYDCTKLFVDGADNPFFADRLFANRLVNLVEALKRGTQQNRIYIFEGPPGCGKSTFLNNLLKKFEEYTNTDAGSRYEVVWRLDTKLLGGPDGQETLPLIGKIIDLVHSARQESSGCAMPAVSPQTVEDYKELLHEEIPRSVSGDYVEVACPSHDHPILMIPKAYRRSFFDDLFLNDQFKWKLFTEKEYDWVFRNNPCTICSSLYHSLARRLCSPQKVFGMIHARPYRFNRRLGEGISVFNPGDKPMRQQIFTNEGLQRQVNTLLRGSAPVRYVFSRYAKTNNGIYALMDIKSHNTERLVELHNIISEGIHKVEDIEENVNSMFLALMNFEDRKNIEEYQSFLDRVEYMKIPYVLDLNTEVEIYRNIFGKHIDDHFLPRVLHNFARVIISTRMKLKSEAMLEWIENSKKYHRYCDDNLQLLKMEIYTGYIPKWLLEEDLKKFNAKIRQKIIAESEKEGEHGLSGRDSLKIFNEFFSTYAKEDKLINMAMLYNYFANTRKDFSEMIPAGLLDSLTDFYNYTILQEVKESLYYYNEEKISRDIQNYMFAVSFEPGVSVTSKFTGDRLEITEEFFHGIENRLLGAGVDRQRRLSFRKEIQKEYTTQALTQEIMVGNKPVTHTGLYEALHERYVYNLKEKVLDPFLENENFRRAIKDFGKEDFKTYDKRIKADVSFLMNNICNKYRYTKKGAKEVCMYVIDNDLARKFATP